MGLLISIRRSLLVLLLALNLPAQAGDWVYAVVEDDTLWNLSVRHLKHTGYWQRLQRINQIENPDLLKPGTQLRIPMEWLAINPAVAQVEALTGQATLTTDGGETTTPLKKGDEIGLGARIQTGEASSLAVRFADGSLVSVFERSIVDFDHLSAYGDNAMIDTRLRLQQGRVDTRAQKAQGPGSRFEIETPAAISAVRGTRYRTSHSTERDASTVEVLEGGVGVTGANTTRSVGAAFGLAAQPERPPDPPRPLLAAPSVDPIPRRIDQLNRALTWAAIGGAVAYRVTIADTADFTTVRWQRLASTARVALPDLANGRYFVQVRAVDPEGIEGLDTVEPIHIATHPIPPLPIAPTDAAVLRGAIPELRWTASAEAASYRLQLSDRPDFTTLLIDRSGLTDTRLRPESIDAPGEYYWRIASSDANGGPGPFGATRQLTLRPIPAAMEAKFQSEDETLVATWPAGQGGQRFQVQVADDPDFNNLVSDIEIAESRLPLEPTPGQVRYLRIRVIEPDGYLGPWGGTQQLDPPPDDSWWMVVLPGLLGLLFL